MLNKIIADHQQFEFELSDNCRWSPRNNTIHYVFDSDETGVWSLLHELGHALLGHHEVRNDLTLVKCERAAWDKAIVLARQYSIDISEDHIEDCLDTYRDWLFRRSRCPDCQHAGVQTDRTHYFCFNCYCQWRVPLSQTCAVQRRRVA